MARKRTAWAAVAAGVLAGLCGGARADITIIGALTNFDCPNNTGQPCDEFEIEFQGPHPEDVVHTWANYNYGAPTVGPNADGSGIIIDYKRAGHSTTPGAIEHYGVYLTTFANVTSRQFRWKSGGAVVASGVGTPPVIIPRPVVVPPPTPAEPPELAEAVELEVEAGEPAVWIQRRVGAIAGEVRLDQLMPDDPVVQATLAVDVALRRLHAGETIDAVEPLEAERGVQTQIIVVETYEDTVVNGVPAPGRLLSRAMSGTVVQTSDCTERPAITRQPRPETAVEGGSVRLTVNATEPDVGGSVSYQWRHEGVAIPGATAARLDLAGLTAADAGSYTCDVSNGCGSTRSQAARVEVTPAPCVADFNGVNGVEVLDIFDFLSAWFASDPRANIDARHGVDLQDIFAFLERWFAGC